MSTWYLTAHTAVWARRPRCMSGFGSNAAGSLRTNCLRWLAAAYCLPRGPLLVHFPLQQRGSLLRHVGLLLQRLDFLLHGFQGAPTGHVYLVLPGCRSCIWAKLEWFPPTSVCLSVSLRCAGSLTHTHAHSRRMRRVWSLPPTAFNQLLMRIGTCHRSRKYQIFFTRTQLRSPREDDSKQSALVSSVLPNEVRVVHLYFESVLRQFNSGCVWRASLGGAVSSPYHSLSSDITHWLSH